MYPTPQTNLHEKLVQKDSPPLHVIVFLTSDTPRYFFAAAVAQTAAKISKSVYDRVPLSRNKEEIRLLTIEPGETTDPLACTLQKTSLDDKPYYSAISYVWGGS
jgi:hypothetical protein